MASQLDLIFNNNKINRYGFRVLTEGINTENYMKNPVVLAYHEDRQVSVGKTIELTKSADNTLKPSLFQYDVRAYRMPGLHYTTG